VIDLHAHTTASDGRLSPTELVAKAQAEGLTALAITDHDTTAGVAEAQAAGRDLGIEVIPGIEISVAFEVGTFHMLGLFIDPHDPTLATELEKVLEARNARNRVIAEKLNRMGVPIRLTDVIEMAGGGVVGRPHFARVMIDMCVVRDLSEAFQRFLKKGGPAYEGRYRTDREEAISLIHSAGGVSVLCHPHTLGLDEGGEQRAFFAELKALGLDALEAHYGEYRASERRRYEALAAAEGLLVSGGSDFHAEGYRGPRLSRGRSGIPVPVEILSALRERAEVHRSRA
jgi:predicted metal-dependent phosphoesterase TrpH